MVTVDVQLIGEVSLDTDDYITVELNETTTATGTK